MFFDFFLVRASNFLDVFRENARVILVTALVVLVVVGAAFALAFFTVIESAEKVMVPEAEGKELAEALIEMQARELYPQVQLRYSERPEERGLVLEQDPKAGAIVKAGKRVSLVVSRGVIIDRVEDFIGRNINDVRVDLQALFTAGSVPLLSIKEPVLYRASAEPAGTILEQDPAPDTPIGDPVQVSLVVSRGPESDEAVVPNVIGMSIAEIIRLMEQSELAFSFTARLAQVGETAGTVVSQQPAGNTRVQSFGVVEAVIAVPAVAPRGYVYGIFSEELPEYPYPFQITLEVISPLGERSEYASFRHPGGHLSVPYLLPEGSMIALSVLNREALSRQVEAVSVVQEETL